MPPPWRGATRVQPPRTRLIDLGQDEEALRGAMKRKHRQYVAKAEREGMTVEQMDGSAFQPIADQWLDDFYAIYAHTAERAGFVAAPAITTSGSGSCSPLPATSASRSPRATASGWRRSSTSPSAIERPRPSVA